MYMHVYVYALLVCMYTCIYVYVCLDVCIYTRKFQPYKSLQGEKKRERIRKMVKINK